jgi:hypothetical protein
MQVLKSWDVVSVPEATDHWTPPELATCAGRVSPSTERRRRTTVCGAVESLHPSTIVQTKKIAPIGFRIFSSCIQLRDFHSYPQSQL